VNERLVVFQYTVEQDQRLDKFLVICLPEFSRSRLQSFIKEGLVTIDGEIARKTGQMLRSPCTVQVHIPETAPGELVPEPIPLDIIFENNDVLVVNKPAGMVVHPAAGHASGTLVHAALGHAPELEGVGGEHRPGVVHRLDKNTSGLIILAKNDLAHRYLQEQFSQRLAKKTYFALVDGCPPTPIGRIEAPIGRDPRHRKKMAIVSPGKGRAAVSEYRILESFPAHALLEVKPLTGRTHQIRLHLAYIGCPVAGDTTYGKRQATIPLERHFLHASYLTIQLPDESEPRTFHAPLPPELVEVLKELGAVMIE